MQWCDNVRAACIICTCVSGCPSHCSSGCRVSRTDCPCQVRHTQTYDTLHGCFSKCSDQHSNNIFSIQKTFLSPPKTFLRLFSLQIFFSLLKTFIANFFFFPKKKIKTLPIKHWSALLLYWLNRIYTQHKCNITTCMLQKVMQKLRWTFTKLHRQNL